MTCEGWVDIMYMIQDSKGWTGTTIYFLAVIIFGNFFLLNIMLAVVWDAYQDLSSRENDAVEEASSPPAKAATKVVPEEEEPAQDEPRGSTGTPIDGGDSGLLIPSNQPR